MTLLARPNGSWIDRFLAVPLALLLIAGPGSLDAWALNLELEDRGQRERSDRLELESVGDSGSYRHHDVQRGRDLHGAFPGTVPSTNFTSIEPAASRW